MIPNAHVFAALKAAVGKQRSEHLVRHEKVGLPITRMRALDVAINQQQEKLIQTAEQWEREDKEESAEAIRELALLLPDLIWELGLR